jgi:hypothetical protein
MQYWHHLLLALSSSGTLAWLVHATTWPKLRALCSLMVKGQPASLKFAPPPRCDYATIYFLMLCEKNMASRGCQSLSQDPPRHAFYLILCGRGLLVSAEASASPPDKSMISYHPPVASCSSPFPSKEAAASDAKVRKCHCGESLLHWCLIAIVRGCRWDQFLEKEDNNED